MNNDDDPWSDSMKFWSDMHQQHSRLDEGFQRLCCEPTTKIPKKGDRVIVAAGFIGMGHPWVRLEAVVMECGDTSYKVRFADRAERVDKSDKWVHQALITDVLSNAPSAT